MEERKLGTQGLTVSALGLGCMGMSDFYGGRDQKEAMATLHYALAHGINFLDTSDMYGPFTNEELVGRAIKGHRNQAVIATKFGIIRGEPSRATGGKAPIVGINGRPEYVRSACDASLKRLAIDHIDLYYQHRVDPDVPIEETVGAMSDLVAAGKVRFLGLSEAATATIRRAHAIHPISALQSEFSLWSRDIEAEILPTLRELDIGLVAYSPLGRGFLTGQIKRFEDFAADDYRRMSPRFQGENFEKNLKLVKHIEGLAERKGVTLAQLALAWVLAQSEDIVPIPGTKRRAYLKDNLGTLQVHLSEQDLAEIAAAMPPDAVSGERYPEAMMQFVNR